ncbi:adenosine deaminase [Aquipuribacter nitratireducens]|uniref:Adenosine deaminase n=1 Tax=Aquipuribacter nitratireducens TaxID=650104 RepID=A0ABW0GJ87_9MICO
MTDEELVDALPKHELHVHLEGSMPPETLLALRHRHGLHTLPGDLDGIRDLYEFRDFDHFIRTYLAVVQALREEEDFELLARSALGLLADQVVRYAEVTWTPVLHADRGVPVEAVFAGLEAGRLAVEAEGGPVVRWVTDLPGHLGPDAAERTLDLVLGLGGGTPPPSVVGFGLGGPEVDRAPFAAAFARARAAGLRSLPHAGEVTGPESVRAALDHLGAERLGHGIAVAQDAALMAEVAERGVVVEVCPTSNLRTRVVASYEEHPLRRMLDAGVAVTINSDDPPMFGTTLREEHLVALRHLGLGPAELLACARTAATAGSAPPAVVERTLADLDALEAVAVRR